MVALPETRTVPLDSLVPYENNPRRIPREAVEAVRDSIERYGYQQPIVVDRDNVVVVGHTRMMALQEMGVTEVDVYVTDLPADKAREFRLVDNRTSELSTWDHAALVVELREFEKELAARYFPDVNVEIKTLEDIHQTARTVEEAQDWALEMKKRPEYATTDVVCPSCFHTFRVRTDSLPRVNDGGAD